MRAAAQRFTRVDLAQVCTNVFELYEPLAEAKPVAFTLDAPAPLPVRGDFELLVEAIANLVDNAQIPTGRRRGRHRREDERGSASRPRDRQRPKSGRRSDWRSKLLCPRTCARGVIVVNSNALRN